MRSRYEDEDDDGRDGGGRGFAGMDPERRREIASMGGRASHGGHGRDYESSRGSSRSPYDAYEYDRGSRSNSGGRGFAGMDPERLREVSAMGGRASHRHDYDDGGSSYRSSSSRYEDEDERGGSGGGRGFAGMDPERQREIASMGGRASHGGHGRDWEDGGGSSYRSSSRSRYEEDDDRTSHRGGGRGFAGMDPERQREIASMGGRASHGGRGRDWDDGGGSSSYRSSSRSRYDEDEDDDRYGRSGGRGNENEDARGWLLRHDDDEGRSRGRGRSYAGSER